VPDPDWPAPPSGWEFWLTDEPAPAPAGIRPVAVATDEARALLDVAAAPEPARAPAPEIPDLDDAPRPRWLVGAGAAAVLGAGILLVTFIMREQPHSAPVGSSAVTVATSRAVSTPGATPSPQRSTAVAGEATTVRTGAPGTALEALDALEVRSSTPVTPYTRAAFSTGWVDVDHNGCDTGNDVLRRDLTSVVTKPGSRGCIVTSGRLLDRYVGRSTVLRTGARTVAIDFVVPLADAWTGGAHGWTAAQRTRFVNDPANLSAVQTTTTQKKRSQDAAGWLPSAVSYRCTYVARQIAVKATYGISVTAAERTTMRRVLAACPGQSLPAGTRGSPAARTATQQPATDASRPLLGPAPSSSATPTG
jgi:hypothetical protein